MKPGASLVAYGYGVCQVEPEKAGQIFSHVSLIEYKINIADFEIASFMSVFSFI